MLSFRIIGIGPLHLKGLQQPQQQLPLPNAKSLPVNNTTNNSGSSVASAGSATAVSSSSSLITQHATPIAFSAVAKHNANLLEQQQLHNGPSTVAQAVAGSGGGGSAPGSVASSGTGPYAAAVSATVGSPGGVSGGGGGNTSSGHVVVGAGQQGLPYSFTIRQIPNNNNNSNSLQSKRSRRWATLIICVWIIVGGETI